MLLLVAATLGGSHTALGCAAPQEMMRFKVRLPNTARAIRSGKPLVIVAIGSSSTQGVGASDLAHTYPALLAEDLRRREYYDEGREPDDANEFDAESYVILLLQRVVEGKVPLLEEHVDVNNSETFSKRSWSAIGVPRTLLHQTTADGGWRRAKNE
jgi:hypothetical protein